MTVSRSEVEEMRLVTQRGVSDAPLARDEEGGAMTISEILRNAESNAAAEMAVPTSALVEVVRWIEVLKPASPEDVAAEHRIAPLRVAFALLTIKTRWRAEPTRLVQ